MNQEQQSHRRAAAKAFFDSLDQFQETLEISDSQSNITQTPPANDISRQPERRVKSSFNLADLEEAVADIDQYFQSLQGESAQSKD